MLRKHSTACIYHLTAQGLWPEPTPGSSVCDSDRSGCPLGSELQGGARVQEQGQEAADGASARYSCGLGRPVLLPSIVRGIQVGPAFLRVMVSVCQTGVFSEPRTTHLTKQTAFIKPMCL